MKVSQAAEIWMNFHQVQSKRDTVWAYQTVITKFYAEFGKADLGALTPDEDEGILTSSLVAFIFVCSSFSLSCEISSSNWLTLLCD